MGLPKLKTSAQAVSGMTLQAVVTELCKLPGEKRTGIALLKVLRQLSPDAEGGEEKPRWAPAESIAGLSSEELAAWLMGHLAKDLAYIHSHGRLHLAIHPENIFIQESGQPVLGGGSPRSTDGPGNRFSSPEQIAVLENPQDNSLAVRVGPASDLYALGAVLQEFLSPAAGDIDSFPLRAIVERCLNVNPAERFADASVLAESLFTAQELFAFSADKTQLRYRRVSAHAAWLPWRGLGFTALAFLLSAAALFPLLATYSLNQCALIAGLWWVWNAGPLFYWWRCSSAAKKRLVEQRTTPLLDLHATRQKLLQLPRLSGRVCLVGWLVPLLFFDTNQGLVGAAFLLPLAASFAASLPRYFLNSVYLAFFLGSNQLKPRIRAEFKILGRLLPPQLLSLAAPAALAVSGGPGSTQLLALAVATFGFVSLLRNFLFRRAFLSRLA